MATEIEKLRKGEFICRKCGLRKNSEHQTSNGPQCGHQPEAGE